LTCNPGNRLRSEKGMLEKAFLSPPAQNIFWMSRVAPSLAPGSCARLYRLTVMVTSTSGQRLSTGCSAGGAMILQ
jgi:hypothetical protein